MGTDQPGLASEFQFGDMAAFYDQNTHTWIVGMVMELTDSIAGFGFYEKSIVVFYAMWVQAARGGVAKQIDCKPLRILRVVDDMRRVAWDAETRRWGWEE